MVILLGDAARHRGELCPTPIFPLPTESILPSPLNSPVGKFQVSFRTIPLYEAAPSANGPRSFSYHARRFEASHDVFAIITHNFPLDVLEFVPK